MNRSILALGLGLLSLGLACTISESSKDPQQVPGYSLSVNPGSIALQRGTSGSLSVTVNAKNGFAGPVALSLVGQPAGAESTFTPATATSAGSVQVSTAWSTSAGNYPVTIKGTSPGLPDATVAFTLQVTNPPPVSLAWSPCEYGYQPIWLAYQDGDGPWTAVNGAAGSYSFTIREGRGGVAWVSTSATWGGSMLRVTFGTTGELTAQAGTPCEDYTAVRGVLKNFPASRGYQTVSMGSASGSSTSWGAVNYWQVEGVRKRSSMDFLAMLPRPQPVAVFRPGISLPVWPAPMAPELDFDSPEAFALQTQKLTVTGDLTGITEGDGSCHLSTPGLERGFLWNQFTYGNPFAFPSNFFCLPAAKLPAGGIQRLRVIAKTPGDQGEHRIVELYFTAPEDKVLQLPARAARPTLEMVGGAAYARPRFSGSFQAPYGQAFLGELWQQIAGVGLSCSLAISRAYLQGATAFQVSLPDFAGLPGWNPEWGPKAGNNGEWSATLSGGSTGARPVPGDTVNSCMISGLYTAQ
jgi:hypothetical protein